jgi:hypothetical protein
MSEEKVITSKEFKMILLVIKMKYTEDKIK